MEERRNENTGQTFVVYSDPLCGSSFSSMACISADNSRFMPEGPARRMRARLCSTSCARRRGPRFIRTASAHPSGLSPRSYSSAPRLLTATR